MNATLDAIAGPSEEESTLHAESGPDDWGRWGMTTKKPKKPTKKALLIETFKGKSYDITISEQTFMEACEIKKNGGPHEDYTSVFLAHARLYAFAEKYGIKPLKALALSEIHETLGAFISYNRRVGDVIELVKYAYCDEHISKTDNMIDKESEKFLCLLRVGGPFVRDVTIQSTEVSPKL